MIRTFEVTMVVEVDTDEAVLVEEAIDSMFTDEIDADGGTRCGIRFLDMHGATATATAKESLRGPKSRWTAEEFNALYPIGTKVIFTPVWGVASIPKEHRLTRSVAWQLPSGEPVVLLEGRSGGCGLAFLEIDE